MPASAAAVRAASEGSKPVTSQPALWSVAAIAPPMDPRPMTAMRRSVLVFMKLLLEEGMWVS